MPAVRVAVEVVDEHEDVLELAGLVVVGYNL